MMSTEPQQLHFEMLEIDRKRRKHRAHGGVESGVSLRPYLRVCLSARDSISNRHHQGVIRSITTDSLALK